MNCTQIQNAFLDFEAGTLRHAEANAIRGHLQSCPDCQREWANVQSMLLILDRIPAEAPSPRMRAQFYAMLDTHIRSTAKSRSPFGSPRNWADRWLEALWSRRPALQLTAAVVLLVFGLTVGMSFRFGVRPAEVASAAQLAATQKELAELRTRVDSVNQLVAFSLSQEQPAHTRLQRVMSTLTRDGEKEPTLAQLLGTVAFDPSTNIRLSALEALYAHGHETGVRRGVLAALPRETSPLVQVAMIDFLASVRESAAVTTFQEIARTPTADPSVRMAAERAITLL